MVQILRPPLVSLSSEYVDRTFSGALVGIDAAGALATSLSYEEALRLSSNSSRSSMGSSSLSTRTLRRHPSTATPAAARPPLNMVPTHRSPSFAARLPSATPARHASGCCLCAAASSASSPSTWYQTRWSRSRHFDEVDQAESTHPFSR